MTQNLNPLDEAQSIQNAGILIERFGGIRPMASKISVPVTTVQGWKKRDVIPGNRVEMIVQAAKDHNVEIGDILKTAPIANENEKNVLSARRPEETLAAPVAPVSAPKMVGANAVPAEIYQDIVKKLQFAEKKAITTSAFINVFLILLTVGFALFLFWPQSKVAKNSARIVALEQNMAELQGTVANVEQQEQKTMLDKVVSPEVQAAGQAAFEQAQVIGQQVVETSSAAIAQTVSSVSDVVTRWQALQATGGETQISAAWTQVSGYLAGLQNGTQTGPWNLDSALEMLRAQNPAVSQMLQGVSASDLKQAATMLGMTQLHATLGQDNVPFEQDISALKTLMGNNDPELESAMNNIAPMARTGVLSPETLSNEFQSLSNEIVESSLSGADVAEKAKASLNQFMQVEKNGALVSGTPTQGIVLGTQKMLAQGDIESAIAMMNTLTGPAAVTATPWMTKAQATLQAQKLKLMLTRMLNSASGKSLYSH